jgi:hypothetical protein
MADPNSRTRDLAWAAGLFEGEGCITHNGHRASKLTPKLVLVTADEDIANRFMSIVRCGIMRRQCATRVRIHKSHYKDRWEWRVVGFERTQYVIALLWNGLGARRRERAKEILQWQGIGAPEHAFLGSRGKQWSTRRETIATRSSIP